MPEPTPTHFLGISIGPVVDTLLRARKTRELWTASYLFSSLMARLIAAVEKEGGKVLAPVPARNLKPDGSQGEPITHEALFGAGILPDRLYAKFSVATDRLEQTFTNVCNSALAGVVADVGGSAAADAYFSTFFRIANVWLSADDVAGNLLQPLNDLLDSQELQPAYFAEPPVADIVTRLLDKPYGSPMVRHGLVRHPENAYQGLVEAEITKQDGRMLRLNFDFFPSTAQIASVGLYHHDPGNYYWLLEDLAGNDRSWTKEEREARLQAGTEDDERQNNDVLIEFYRLLEGGELSPGFAGKLSDTRKARISKGVAELKSHYQEYHKYFCIVHADGDRFGEVIKALGTDETAIHNFSQELANFAAEAASVINDYGGKPIYIGGDDLLFFAPVTFYSYRHKRKTTVFDLLAQLDITFASYNFSPQPSLSYGLTLSHYKYPLFEARDASFDALTRAKKLSWTAKPKDAAGEHLKKNGIAFRLIRHGGSYFDGYLDKALLNQFNTLRQFRGTPGQDFLSSFTFKLQELESLLEALGDDLTEARLKTVITNFFDEDIHRKNQAALHEFVKFYQAVLTTTFSGPEATDPRRNAYALLRVMSFTLPQKKQAHAPATV